MRNAFFITTMVILFALSVRAVPSQISITRLEGAIVIDGDLTDAGWQKAIRVSDFYEYWKNDNAPAPAPTVAMLTYDDGFVYIGFRAIDPSPRSIRAPFVDRDKVLGDQDYVAIVVDTRNDRKSAISFRVNPRGIQTDSVVNDATGSEDFSPDFFYESVARPTPDGWAAEMRIPLSSLRYPNADVQSWGLMLLRNYPRDFRYIMSNTPIPKNRNCFICHASTLNGLDRLPSGDHLTFTPYSTAQTVEHSVNQSKTGDGAAAADRTMQRDPLRSDVGLDFKWNRSAALTLDATLNPDFSQIESDVPQLSVNRRFALDFPEKRTFFLEGVDLLSTPIRAVNTRAITSPAWGMRATGQVGAGAYTLLLAEDRGGGNVILPGTYGSESAPQAFRSRVLVGRYRRGYGASFAGLLMTARESQGGGHNRLFGPDIAWKPNGSDRLLAQFLVSDTENPNRPALSKHFDGRSSRGSALRLQYTRDMPKYDIWVSFNDFSPGFRADTGFVPQVGQRIGYAEIAGHVYPKSGFFSYIRPYYGSDYGRAYEGGQTTRRGIFPGVYFQGKWGSDGWMTIRGAEAERVNGNLLEYSFLEFMVRANPWRAFPALSLNVEYGGKLDYVEGRKGRGGLIDAGATMRPTDHLELQASSKHEWLDLEEGKLFRAAVERLKITYTFSARSLVRVIGQYTEVERSGLYRNGTPLSGGFNLSALYGYKLNWQTLFFVGYGDEQTLESRNTLRPTSRSLFMKVAYAFQR